MSTGPHDPEWLVRKKRIDPQLDAAGWPRAASPILSPHRLEEYETANGPADYALAQGNQVLGIVQAKKLTLGPQNVLTQAERYSRGATSNPLNFHGFHVPFLYSTNGEVLWFRDARHPLNRSRRIASFHTPAALTKLMPRVLETELHPSDMIKQAQPSLTSRMDIRYDPTVNRLFSNSTARWFSRKRI
jgi:type I restriction enzyme R subunit